MTILGKVITAQVKGILAVEAFSREDEFVQVW